MVGNVPVSGTCAVSKPGIDPKMLSMMKSQLPSSLFKEVLKVSGFADAEGHAPTKLENASSVAEATAKAVANMRDRMRGGTQAEGQEATQEEAKKAIQEKKARAQRRVQAHRPRGHRGSSWKSWRRQGPW